MLEVAIANLCSTDKDHQGKILAASAINGRIAHGKEKLLKNEIVDAKASSLVKAVVAFVKQLSKDTVVSKASRDSKWRLSTKQKAELKQGWMIARFLFPQSNLSEVTFATNSAVFLQALHAQLRKTGSEKFPLKGRIMASQIDRSIKPRNAKNQLCQMV